MIVISVGAISLVFAPAQPSANSGRLPAAYIAATETLSKDLVSVAASDRTFSTLVEAINAADLTATLSANGPYTIFAPTDAAFAALPKKTLQNLFKPSNKQQLVKILTYHVVAGDLTSSKLKPGKLKTLEGSSVTVAVNITNNKITINKAKITQINIPASNGVIHVIDRVLLPPKTKF